MERVTSIESGSGGAPKGRRQFCYRFDPEIVRLITPTMNKRLVFLAGLVLSLAAQTLYGQQYVFDKKIAVPATADMIIWR